MNENNENESFYRDTIEDMGGERYQLEDPMTFWDAQKKTFWKKILGRTETPFVLMGIGLVIVVVAFYAIYPRGGEQDAFPDSGALSDRLTQVEEKIGGMEALLEELDALKKDIEPVKNAILRLDATDASMSTRLDRMEKQLASLQKEMEEIKNKTSAEAKSSAASTTKSTTSSAPAETKKTGAQAVYYEVQKGDTLYSISRRYGVSVKTIRDLNSLSEKDAIQPGQKLKVKE